SREPSRTSRRSCSLPTGNRRLHLSHTRNGRISERTDGGRGYGAPGGCDRRGWLPRCDNPRSHWPAGAADGRVRTRGSGSSLHREFAPSSRARGGRPQASGRGVSLRSREGGVLSSLPRAAGPSACGASPGCRAGGEHSRNRSSVASPCGTSLGQRFLGGSPYYSAHYEDRQCMHSSTWTCYFGTTAPSTFELRLSVPQRKALGFWMRV